MVAALVLLFAMAVDWYSTKSGEEARRIEKISDPSGAQAGEVERTVEEEARLKGEGAERNAWQTSAFVDDLILLALIATVGLALAAGFFRAADRRFEPPLTPTALAACAAGVAGLLVAYRVAQQPGFDGATTIQAGVPLALTLLGVITLACAAGMRAEAAGTAFKELPPDPTDRGDDDRGAARERREEQRRRERPA